VTLAVTIIFFLSGITMLEAKNDAYIIGGLFAAAGVALSIFILVEKRAKSPIIDFNLMRSRAFLPPTIILLLTFLSMFMVYLTIPVLVRSPAPLGFGGDAVAVASTQLPFMAVFLAGTISSGFILNRVRNTKLVLVGSVIGVAGFLLLLASHSTSESVSIGLTVIAVGLSLCMTGGFNTILVSVPPQATGAAMGMTMLLNLIGMSTGPALAGMLQETHRGSVAGFEGTFPTGEAYFLIFSVSVVLSIISLAIAAMLVRSPPAQSAPPWAGKNDRKN
jgi:predicted MFS family arabinose efflux permease